MKNNNTTAAEPVKLDVSMETLHPEQPDFSSYDLVTYRGKTFEPKPYEKILLQAYNHPEINWDAVNEQRAKAQATLSADEWLLYRKADKTFRVWYMLEDNFTTQFEYFSTYTNLLMKMQDKDSKDIQAMLNSEEMAKDFRVMLSRIFAVLTMEKRMFISNSVRDFIEPAKIQHHLITFFGSLFYYCRLAHIDIKPTQTSFEDVINIITFDETTYASMKSTVLFYSEQIKL